MIYEQLVDILKEENVEKNKPLKQHTYTRLGGHADYFVTPETYEQVQAIVRFADEQSIPFMLLGNGSNLIIKDGGIRGIVMYLGKLNNMEITNDKLTAESGALIAKVSAFALEKDLSGLEFACGIPGSIGGALFMNAGAYGGEIKDVLESALIMTKDGSLDRKLAKDLNLNYRTSNISSEEYIVLEATFALKEAKHEDIKAVMDDLTFKRESKQPLEYPTCGSVFKRPPGNYAGKLIQDSGLQGKQIGGAQVSLKHAGFIINKDNATANEYIGLIEYIQAEVKRQYAVELEREVRIIGEDLGSYTLNN